MEYEDFEIGDRVGRFYGDKIEKATVDNITKEQLDKAIKNADKEYKKIKEMEE